MFKEIYLQTSGQCSRKQFWIFGIVPFSFIAGLLCFLIWFRILGDHGRIIIGLLFLWPILLLAIKRLRAFGVSGWWVLVIFAPLPYAAVIFYLALGFIPDKLPGPDEQ
jgi:uncharacterized membrane protein YhaH (DUF805 family)